jgi:hypothetical protein
LQHGAGGAVRRAVDAGRSGETLAAVWEIDKKLQEDGVRPLIYHLRLATCVQPQVKGLTVMVNSQYNGWRMEDVWLDR